MKHLNLSPVVGGKAMPLKKGSLIFIQLAYKELLAELCLAKVGAFYNNSTYYIIRGCEKIVSGGTTTILKGCIYYSGEMYISNVVSFPNPSGSNVVVGNIVQTQYSNVSADPVTYSDSSTGNVHDVREFVFSVGASGSGDIDYSALTFAGAWTTPASITITPDIGTVLSYGVIGNTFRLNDSTLNWNFSIAGVNLSSVPVNIKVELPPELIALGYFIKSTGTGFAWYLDSAGVNNPIYCIWNAGNNYVELMRDSTFTTNFLSGTNQALSFNITLELDF